MRRRSLSTPASGLLAAAVFAALFSLPSCVHVSSDPVEVKPIHIVMDVNVRIDRQLDEFFAFENKYQPPPTTQAATQPTASASH